MRIMTLDDERFSLENLNSAIMEAVPDAELLSFTRASDALRSIEEGGYRPEAAFLDIEMPGITGIELASRIRRYSGDTWIIFVSGHSRYALDAFEVHAGGYILKPATAKSIREELDNMMDRRGLQVSGGQRLTVRCFGEFEVYSNGAPVTFSRQKSKELFAYLVHKRGAACTNRELAAVLFEDEPYDAKQQSYMRTIIASMDSMSSAPGSAQYTTPICQYTSLSAS